MARKKIEVPADEEVSASERHELKKAARDRIVELAEANGGRITPEQVLEDARDPESPLHNYFEWDVETAARQYWLDQARTLIRSVKIVTREEPPTEIPLRALPRQVMRCRAASNTLS